MVPVVCPCIAGVAADLLYVNTEQAFVQRDATAHDQSHIGLADAHNPVRDALPGAHSSYTSLRRFSQCPPRVASGPSDSTSRSHSTSHPCTSYRGLSSRASTPLRVAPAVPVSSSSRPASRQCHPTQLRLLEGLAVQFVKIILRKRKIRCFLSKIRYIDFVPLIRFPRFELFHGDRGNSFTPYQIYEFSITLSINLLESF